MELKERIKKHYKSQRACQRVLRVKTYQQFWEAIQPNSPQRTLQRRIIRHLDKLDNRPKIPSSELQNLIKQNTKYYKETQ